MSDQRLILLTGGAGFVGRHLLERLAVQGVAVRLIVRTPHQSADAAMPGVTSIVTSPDIFAEDVSWWTQACADVDSVIHAAWYAEPGQYLRSDKNLACLTGTLALAQGAVQAGVRRFVGVGTCFEYDLGVGALATSTPLKPATLYAASKAAAYMVLSNYLSSTSMAFAWCRLFYLHGAGEDPRRLVPLLHQRLAAGEPVDLTDGSQIRDYLDVREAARQIVDAALSQVQGALNICSGVPVSVRQMAEHVADQYGRRDLLRFGARAHSDLDPPFVVGLTADRVCH